MKPIKVNLNVSNISKKNIKSSILPPNYVDLINKINSLRETNCYSECIEMCNKVILLYPHYVHAWNILALITMNDDFRLASEYFEKIINMKTSDLSSKAIQLNAFRNLATCHHNIGNYKEAINYYNLYFNESEKFYSKTSNIKPSSFDDDNIRTYLAIVDCYMILDNFIEAKKILIILEKLKNPTFSYLIFAKIGILYFKSGDLSKSYSYYRKSLLLNDKYYFIHSCLGDFYLTKNDIKKAEYHFNKSFYYNPQHYTALRKLDKINKIDLEDKTVKELEIKVNKLRSDNNKSHTMVDSLILKEGGQILYSLYEKKGLYDKAFDYLKLSNDTHLLNKNYSFSLLEKEFDKIIKLFSKDFFSKISPINNSSAKPIFIIGLPRSGSTLVEQILSSHSNVSSCGEVDYLHSTIKKLFNNKTLSKESIKDFKNLSHETKSFYAESYVNSVREFSGAAKENRITDKSLVNFIHVGLIHLLFPNAKIINLNRSPEDVCFAIYRTSFDASFYDWTYKLETIAQYFLYNRKIMNHWEKVIPGKIYNISYESLVKSPTNEIKDLLSYCELPFENNCLNFHKNTRTILTASSLQVRDKINYNSIDRVKNYQKYLKLSLSKLL